MNHMNSMIQQFRRVFALAKRQISHALIGSSLSRNLSVCMMHGKIAFCAVILNGTVAAAQTHNIRRELQEVTIGGHLQKFCGSWVFVLHVNVLWCHPHIIRSRSLVPKIWNEQRAACVEPRQPGGCASTPGSPNQTRFCSITKRATFIHGLFRDLNHLSKF